MKHNKIIIICLTIILIIIIPIYSIAEENTDELKQAIQQMKESYQQLNIAKDEINNIEDIIAQIELTIQDYDTSIQQATDNLNQVNKQLKEKERILLKRARQIYMYGNIEYFIVLFTNKSFSEMINIASGISNIAKQDTRLLREIISIRKEKQSIINDLRALQKEQSEKLSVERVLLQSAMRRYEIQQEEHKKEEEAFAALAARYGKNINNYHFDLNLRWPFDDDIENAYLLTATYGWRYLDITGTDFHTGIDIGVNYGTPIHSIADGTIELAEWYGGAGNCVIVNHGTDNQGKVITSLYGHMSKIAVSHGQHVTKNDIIGYVGSTGLSTGPHLHLTILEDGKEVNPLTYFVEYEDKFRYY